MFDWRRKEEGLQVIRYYLAGVLNMGFAYVLFVLFLAFGMQVYVAQAVGHMIGMAFNYYTYSRFAFSGQKSSKKSYILSYVANYFLGLGALWGFLKVFPSPYIAGMLPSWRFR